MTWGLLAVNKPCFCKFFNTRLSWGISCVTVKNYIARREKKELKIKGETIVQADTLKTFCRHVFEKLGVSTEDADVTADVLVQADLRGIGSHGVARLRRYVNGLREGQMAAMPNVTVVHETSTTTLIDGDGGLGPPIGVQGMRMAIEKAKEIGVGFVAARNSNHYGIAGYYAMMALEHEYIGISLTNADVLVVPTFGRNAMLGTNPISVAVPSGGDYPFVLDMATSVIPKGKIEVYQKLNKELPIGWASDELGIATTDSGQVLHNLNNKMGGGLLPLGGVGEVMGGHKGYGLALLVDILCGVLSGAGYADTIYPKTPDGEPLPANVGHFFGVLRVDGFRPIQEFKATMDDMIRRMKDTPKAEGQQRIYIHGEKEFETAEERMIKGIPLHPKVVADLKAIAEETGVGYDL
ncbi:MAG: Ldh family oxidoreductase [Deltaproteobacteria bacterium]|nr:Ldh family oxidoreductase [Deltaproteobacteria bacterium]